MKNTYVLALLAIIILTSCKKDPAEPINEPAPSLKGKWNLVSTDYKEFESDTLVNDFSLPGNGATFDFQPDGNVVMKHDGVTETHPYSIQSDSKVDIDGYINEIRNLTSSSVTLYQRLEDSPGNYDEIQVNLKR